MTYFLTEITFEHAPRITYLGTFERLEDALAAKINYSRLNPGRTATILTVLV